MINQSTIPPQRLLQQQHQEQQNQHLSVLLPKHNTQQDQSHHQH